MTRFRGAIGALAFVFASAAVAYAAGMTPQQTVRAFVGTWTCVEHDSHHKTWRETDHDTMFGSWVRMDSMYPAQNGEAAATGIGFFGYDAKHHRWVVGNFDTSGGYSINVSTSPSFNNSHWVDGYPTGGGTATVMMPNATHYTIDSSGSKGTSHTVCTKS